MDANEGHNSRKTPLWSRFLRRRDGVAAVEFTLIAVPFLGLLFAIIEAALVFLFDFTIENASHHIARLIATGQIQQAGVGSPEALKTRYLCPKTGNSLLPSFISCDRLFVDVRTAESFSGSDTSTAFYTDPASLRFCPGDGSSIVVVRLAYALPAFLPPLAVMEGSVTGPSAAGLVDNVPGFPGLNRIIANAEVFQNEAFDASSTTSPPRNAAGSCS